MPVEPSTTITQKLPYSLWQQNSKTKKEPLENRMKDVRDDMIIRLIKKQLDEKYFKGDTSSSSINDNLQHGL